MPRYFFNIRDHEKIIPDEEGLDLIDAETALHEAEAGAWSVRDDALADGDDIAHQVVEVADAEGRLVAEVRLRELLDKDPTLRPKGRPYN